MADQSDSFRSMQDGWKTEIEQIFDELRLKERVSQQTIKMNTHNYSLDVIHSKK